MTTYDEFGVFTFGGTQFPLSTASSATLLHDADPAIFHISEFFKDALMQHLDGRFIQEATAVNLRDTTHVVASTTWFDPTPYLKEGQFRMPLLSVWRDTGDWTNRTVAKRHVESTWNVTYALPPLAMNQLSLLPVLNAVGRVLDTLTERGFDPNIDAGAKIFATAGIESIEFKTEKHGAWQAIDGATFPAVAMTVLVKERIMPTTGAFGPFEGIDTIEDLKPVGETAVSDFVDFATDTT